MGKVEGKVAFVTGGAMGNGLGAVKVLAREGAKVAIADISEKLSDTAKELEAEGYEILPVKVDVSKMEEVKSAVNSVIKKWGRIDILVNNAGVCKLVSFIEMSDEDRNWHWNVNMNGTWNCTKAILPYMIKQKYGKIVNLSSVTGPMVVDFGDSAYGATKAAILGFTRALALECAHHNITVNALCPGYILTPGVEDVAAQSNPGDAQSVLDSIARRVPMGRLGTIEEIGNLVAFLASDESSYITGTQIVIDGGALLPETSGSVGV